MNQTTQQILEKHIGNDQAIDDVKAEEAKRKTEDLERGKQQFLNWCEYALAPFGIRRKRGKK